MLTVITPPHIFLLAKTHNFDAQLIRFEQNTLEGH